MHLRIFSLLFFLSTACLQAFEIATIEEKVGQLLMPHFNGAECNEDALTLLEQVHVGGIIYYKWSNELSSPTQVRALSEGLQKASKIPLWISIDQEGGPVARLDDTFGEFPSQRDVAKMNPIDYYSVAGKTAKIILDLGINMNLAPVVDISTHPQTSYIAKRTYGNTPDEVLPYAKHALLSYRQQHLLGVLKHYPGYGDVVVDPHHDLPVNKKTLEQLAAWELKPYVYLRGLYDAVMTAHIFFPKIDPEHCATLSPLFYEYLRTKIKFDGLVITDSLVMDGVLKEAGTLEAAAIQALKAGADLLIIGGKEDMKVDAVVALHKRLVKAVVKGELPLERVEEAVMRNLKFKTKYLVDRCPKSG